MAGSIIRRIVVLAKLADEIDDRVDEMKPKEEKELRLKRKKKKTT